MEVFSTVFGGLSINLLANVIWALKPQFTEKIRKRWPMSEKFFSLVFATILFLMCILFAGLSNINFTSTEQAGIEERRGPTTAGPGIGPSPTPPEDSSTSESGSTVAGGTNGLIDIILQQQEQYVGKSSGMWAHQNFTEANFATFMQNNMLQKIVDSLAGDREFLAVVDAVKSMSPTEREALLQRGLATCRKTWTEFRLDPETALPEELAKGQTDAGQRAERLIARRIIDQVRSRLA